MRLDKFNYCFSKQWELDKKLMKKMLLTKKRYKITTLMNKAT